MAVGGRGQRADEPAVAQDRLVPPRDRLRILQREQQQTPLDAYFGTGKLLRDVFAPWGLAVDFVDMTDLAAVKAALTARTRVVWIETPSNPLWRVTDIAAVAALAHGTGARCVCDNTAAVAAEAEPKAAAAAPPSSSARHSSSAVRLGLALRL